VNVLINKKGWPVNVEGYCSPYQFPAVTFTREGVARIIRLYRRKCREAGTKPGKLIIKQA